MSAHGRAHVLMATARNLSASAVNLAMHAGALHAGERLRAGALAEIADALEDVAGALRAAETSAE